MATPVTVIEFFWKLVHDHNWSGYQASGFITDVLSCYVEFHIPYVAQANQSTLRIMLEKSRLDDFRNVFPDAELDPGYGITRQGFVTVRLPIPHGYSPFSLQGRPSNHAYWDSYMKGEEKP
jgi:hypothetical protein